MPAITEAEKKDELERLFYLSQLNDEPKDDELLEDTDYQYECISHYPYNPYED